MEGEVVEAYLEDQEGEEEDREALRLLGLLEVPDRWEEEVEVGVVEDPGEGEEEEVGVACLGLQRWHLVEVVEEGEDQCLEEVVVEVAYLKEHL